MAVFPIRTLPDPVLRQKAKKVSKVDDSVKKLVADMLETLHADPGRVGLAAPQIGVSLKVTVICLPDSDEEDIILINPEVVRTKGTRRVEEACLSLPGYYGFINRAEVVTVKGRDLGGKEIRIKGEGLLAQALQHEIDHLDGHIYIDHLESEADLYKVEAAEPGAE